MALLPEERKRVGYLEQRLILFSTQLGKLEAYLGGIDVDRVNAKMRLDNLATIYESSLKYNEELMSIQSDHPQIEGFVEVENRYFEVASAVTRLQQVEPLMSSTLNPNNITITERQDLPRLPEIKIPKFDGKRENWANYKNKFIALVDSRTDISDAVKCSQLFDSLIGQAKAKIDQFDPSEKDYPKAWQSLLDFYDHKRIVAVEHLNALLDLPQVIRESADELSDLVDKARQHIHILAGLDIHPGNDIVVRILERCLPAPTRRRWQDRLDMDEMPKLEVLYKFIQNTVFRLQTAESASSSGRNSKKRVGENLPQSTNKMAKKTSYALSTSASTDSSSSQSVSLACPQCKESHHLFKCPIFNGLGTQERWNLVKKIKACQNCLWIHPFPCKSDKRCKKCSRNHHTLLHNDRKPKQVKTTDANSSASIDVQQ